MPSLVTTQPAVQDSSRTLSQSKTRTRRPSSSALNVAISNIADSNETTNHFLGAGAAQRPWMRLNTNVTARRFSTTSAPGPSVQAGSRSASTIAAPLSSPSVPTVAAPGTTNNVCSFVTFGGHTPPYRFVDAIDHTTTNDPPVTQYARKDVETHALQQHNADDSSYGNIRTEANTVQEPEVMDLISADQETPGNDEHASASAHTHAPDTGSTHSRQPTAYPELPILEVNNDFGLTATENNADAPQPVPASTVAVIGNPGPQSSVTANTQPPGMSSPIVNSSTQIRESPLEQRHNNHPVGQTRLVCTGQTPVATAAIAHPLHMQLLTLEPSPLNRSTQHLPLAQLTSGAAPSSRPQPLLQTPTPNFRPAVYTLPHLVPQPQQQRSHRPGFVSNDRPPPQRVNINVQHHDNSQSRGASYLATLDSNVEDLSRRIDLSRSKWSMRLPWLREACNRSDLLFLQLHQLFCIWNINTATARFLGLSESCDSGFAILELLFGKNTDFPSELLAFLAGWPNSTYSLEFNHELKNRTADISRFMPVLGSRWHSFLHQCLARRFPPTAGEIINALGCPISVVLPGAIFSTIQQRILPTAPHALRFEAFSIFQINMRAAYTGHLDSVLARFLAAYRALYSRHLTTPGLSQIQIDDMRSVLLVLSQRNASRPFGHSAVPVQRQSHDLPNRPLPVSTLSTQVSTAMTQLVHDQSTFASHGNRTTLVSPLQRSSTNRPVEPSAAANPSALPPPQNHVGSLDSAQLPPSSVEAAQSNPVRTNYPVVAIGSIRQAPSPPDATGLGWPSSLSLSPLLSTGHAPPAQEMLLPANMHHLPDLLTNPNSIQEALHQVHLRQPTIELKDIDPGNRKLLFQYVQNLVLQPHTWLPSSGFIAVHFYAPSELLKRKSEVITQASRPFEQTKRVIRPESILFHLRCVKLDDAQHVANIQSSWAATPTYWPQHIFVSINGQHLEIRRKRHHGRDLPIDVTSFIQPDRNEIKVSIHPDRSERDITHGIAVEVIGFHSREQALKLPTTLDAETSLRSIMASMEPHQDLNDDDIVLVDDSMTISVTDPFSSRMYTTPVRGRWCRHRECFDLETFFDSRQSDHRDVLTSVYAWQCPICKRDARPCSLVVDEFFQQVRDKLVKAGDAEVRAIVVRADGTWEAKKEAEKHESKDKQTSPQTGKGPESSSTYAKTEKPGLMSTSLTKTASSDQITSTRMSPHDPRNIEVIELD